MKVVFSMGIINGYKEEELEFKENEFKGMDKQEKNEYIKSRIYNLVSNLIDIKWKIKEE